MSFADAKAISLPLQMMNVLHDFCSKRGAKQLYRFFFLSSAGFEVQM